MFRSLSSSYPGVRTSPPAPPLKGEGCLSGPRSRDRSFSSKELRGLRWSRHSSGLPIPFQGRGLGGEVRPLAFLLVIALLGCAAPAPSAPAPATGSGASSPAAPAAQPQGPKRIVIAMVGDPPGLSTHINPA